MRKRIDWELLCFYSSAVAAGFLLHMWWANATATLQATPM